ncbi:MAG: CynX/NimT family MFS transporter [Stellaceae bacterium]
MQPQKNAAFRRPGLLLGILWLAGADLRLTLLAVSPVLPLIHHDLGLSEKQIGLLSGLPVLLLGLAAIPGSLVIARIGARRATIAGLLFVAASAAARGIGPSWPVLLGATAVMGTGVAVMQPALPTLVAEWFSRQAGFASALYANGLLIGEAVPAALTLPLVLPLVGGSWPASFVLWSMLPTATAALLAFSTPHVVRPTALAPIRWWPDWRHRLPWQLGALLGGTGGLYFSANAFIPDYLHAIGRPELVTAALGALNSAQLPASFLVLFTVHRMIRTRTAFVVMPLLSVLGLVGVMAPSDWLIVLGTGVVGFFGAFTLILTLALAPVLAPEGEVHRQSAAMFAVGYAISFTIPLVGGAIWDATGVPASAFAAGALSAGIVSLAGLTLHLDADAAPA